MSNLLYNSSLDTPMSRHDLRYVATPAPMGSRHLPYSFAEFTDNTVAAIEKEGYEIIEMSQFKPGANYTIFKKPGKQNPAVYKIDEITLD